MASAYLGTAPGQCCSVSPFGASLEICVSVMRPVLTGTLGQPLDNAVLFRSLSRDLCKCYEASAYLETAPGQCCSVSPFGVSLEICVSVTRPVLTLRLPLDNAVLFLLSEPL